MSFLLDQGNPRAIGLGFVSCDDGSVTKSYLSQGEFHIEVVDVEHGKTRLVDCTASMSCLPHVRAAFERDVRARSARISLRARTLNGNNNRYDPKGIRMR